MATRPKMRKLVEKQIAKAIEGDVPAIKEILDRVDGRVPHAIAGDDDEGPINLVVTWKCNSRPSTAVLQLIVKQRQHHRILRHCQEHLVGDPGNADAP